MEEEAVAGGGSEGIGPFIVLAAWLIVLLFIKIGLVGMAVLIEVFYPRHTERFHRTYRAQSGKCFLWGLVNLMVGFFLVILMGQVPVLALFSLGLFFFLVAMLAVGYTPVYRDMGQRLTYTADTDPNVRNMLWGGITAEAAFLAPVLGQLLSTWLTIRGFGAVILTLLDRTSEANAAAPDPPPAPDSSPSE